MRNVLISVCAVLVVCGCGSREDGHSTVAVREIGSFPPDVSEEWVGVVSNYVSSYKTDDFEKMVSLYDAKSMNALKAVITETAFSAQEYGHLQAFCRGMWGRQYELNEIKDMTPDAMLVGLLQHKTSARPEGFERSLSTMTYELESVSSVGNASKEIAIKCTLTDVNGKRIAFREVLTITEELGQWRLSVDNVVAALRQSQARIEAKKAKASLHSPCASAQTNDYLTNDAAKRTIDSIITAYGGEGAIRSVSRLKTTMQMSTRGQQMTVTLYQTKDKLRREMFTTAQRMIQLYDGENATLVQNGQRMPAPPELKKDLQQQVEKGIMQASLLSTYLAPSSYVKYLGIAAYSGNQFNLIETLDVKGQHVSHYFDRKTHREVREIRMTENGDEIQHFESYRTFDGILYPEKTTLRTSDGRDMGGMQLLELSKDFDDAMFSVN